MSWTPDLVWQHLRSCIQEVNAQVHDEPVMALSISSQGEAVVPVSADRQVLANSPVSSDNRAVAQADELVSRLGFDRIYQLTGQPASALFSLPKILWWRTNAPDVFEKAWKFLCYGDFVTLRLGLEPVIDRTMAARTLAYDIHSQNWSDEILDAAGLEAYQLAQVAPSGTVIGEIPAQQAQELGFVKPVQVIVGGHDQPCAALGAGVINPRNGDVFDWHNGGHCCSAGRSPARLAGGQYRSISACRARNLCCPGWQPDWREVAALVSRCTRHARA